ncbi:orotidine-5'-phosphate decarboxylase [Halobacillus litoralis]|uniref:orotidine-5'-phosphate decarboxylase n=1 Tax=Halobacillus litoralis TaxID=45668 RepID=UPI001CFDA30B|nr:orotidine-5'-phosphate decarboxylase [Halobacillus litoralis]
MSRLQPVYFALDFETGEEALSFLDLNQLNGIPVKVGMELFYKEGPTILSNLHERGHPIFLDLKLHDIPETVRRSMRNLAGLNVDVVNIHAQGGSEMIRAAKKGLQEGAVGKPPLLLAVTMLTSTDQSIMQEEMLLAHPLSNIVKHYSELAEQSGADGVVCSVEEAAVIKSTTSLLTLTPGIRLVGGETHDQKRVATPEQANQEGSDSIVVGRAIRDADHPRVIYETIKEAFTYGQTTIDS